MDDQLITIKEFCARFRVGRTGAYALIESGAIKAVKIGRSTRIVISSAREWAAALPVIAPKAPKEDSGDGG